MFLKSRRASRSVDYLLAALSPLAVARATQRYLSTLSEDELAGLIARSTARMDDDERAYLEMSPDFSTFLKQNRRALRTLDRDALRTILMPVIASRAANVEGTEDDGLRSDDLSSQLRAALPPLSTAEAVRRLTTPAVGSYRRTADSASRGTERIRRAFFAADAALERTYRSIWFAFVRATAAAAVALAIVASGAAITAVFIFFLVPTGKLAFAWMTSRPAVTARVPVKHAPVHRVAQHVTPHHVLPVKAVIAQHTAPPATPRPTSTPAPSATPVVTATPTPVPAPTATPVRIAAKPKGETPVQTHESALRRVSMMRMIAGTMPSHEPPLVQRARLIVMSYLDSLMRGDASSALGSLGLSASAGTSNLTEAPILAGATEFRVLRASLADAGSAKVQVIIDSPQGRYFGDYIVSANGPAAWITQHEVIPVESTASRH